VRQDDASEGARAVPPPRDAPTRALRIDGFVRPLTAKACKEMLAESGARAAGARPQSASVQVHVRDTPRGLRINSQCAADGLARAPPGQPGGAGGRRSGISHRCDTPWPLPTADRRKHHEGPGCTAAGSEPALRSKSAKRSDAGEVEAFWMPQIKNLAVVVFAAPEAAEAARQATHGRSWPDNGVRNSLRPRCAPPPGPGRPPGGLGPRAWAPVPRRKRVCCGCARVSWPAPGPERAAGMSSRLVLECGLAPCAVPSAANPAAARRFIPEKEALRICETGKLEEPAPVKAAPSAAPAAAAAAPAEAPAPAAAAAATDNGAAAPAKVRPAGPPRTAVSIARRSGCVLQAWLRRLRVCHSAATRLAGMCRYATRGRC